jgi:protein SCO1/2
MSLQTPTHAPPAASPKAGEGIKARVQQVLARWTGSPIFWISFIAVLFAYPITVSLRREVPKAPPVMFSLPEFALTDHLGKPFGSKELEGHVWVANFIFTSCPTRCPELTETMAKVQKRMRHMGEAERETPEKLNEYAQKHRVNPRRWRFLTGDLTSVKEAVEKGFKMPMDPAPVDPASRSRGESEDGQTLFDITHGTRFVLVDQHNRVRGLYETDQQSIDQMVQDLAAIVNLSSKENDAQALSSK